MPAALRNHSDRPWTAALSGSLRQRGPDPSGAVTISISGRLTGAGRPSLTVELVGRPANGGVTLKHSAVVLTLTDRSRWAGQIGALDGDQMAATVTNAAGSTCALEINLQIDPSTEHVTGLITGTLVPAGRG